MERRSELNKYLAMAAAAVTLGVSGTVAIVENDSSNKSSHHNSRPFVTNNQVGAIGLQGGVEAPAPITQQLQLSQRGIQETGGTEAP
jgi:hypothetical protein